MAHPVLSAYLDRHDLTQDALAKKAGVERATISKVLAGSRRRFSPEVARAISLATDLTLEQLLFPEQPVKASRRRNGARARRASAS
jgi:transcriptional regulator with XRE-family HTH domain